MTKKELSFYWSDFFILFICIHTCQIWTESNFQLLIFKWSEILTEPTQRCQQDQNLRQQNTCFCTETGLFARTVKTHLLPKIVWFSRYLLMKANIKFNPCQIKYSDFCLYQTFPMIYDLTCFWRTCELQQYGTESVCPSSVHPSVRL